MSTPGHTPSHLSVAVRDGNREVMLAGDASYLESTMLSGTVDGVSPDEAVAAATLANIREFCAERPTVYLPTHDPNAAERLRLGRIVDAPVPVRDLV
jgi:glyoxylase-like metal-dependent hydrolase (beta-lactamase superfamily II)